MAPETKVLIEDMLNATTLDPLGEWRTTTWAEFNEANARDDDTLEVVGALGPGESVLLGGGAQPITRVTRLR